MGKAVINITRLDFREFLFVVPRMINYGYTYVQGMVR